MAWLRGVILMSLLFVFAVAHAQFEQAVAFPASVLKEFVLKHPASGKKTFLELKADRQLLLFVFLSPECPLSQQYSLSLNELAKTYSGNVEMVGIFPGKSYDNKTINGFLKKYRIAFPGYVDESKKLSNYLTASVTPEVILLSIEKNELTVQYRGAIDDRVKSLGVKRLQASNYFLKDAIEQYLHQKDVSIKRTDPVGCLINDY